MFIILIFRLGLEVYYLILYNLWLNTANSEYIDWNNILDKGFLIFFSNIKNSSSFLRGIRPSQDLIILIASSYLFLMILPSSPLLIKLLSCLSIVISGVLVIFILVVHSLVLFSTAIPPYVNRLAIMSSTIFGFWYKSFSSLFFLILYSPVFTTLLGSYTFFLALFFRK